MHKAYDTFLQSEVSADMAAKSGAIEPYRYECSCCGEEVRIAAIGSINMVPHFRHRRSNNDVECENYLGQYGVISTDSHSRKSKSERAEFFFDKSTKLFSLGLRLSEDETNTYEQLSTTFELRVLASGSAFYTLPINSRNFSPDVPLMIPLSRFSCRYFLSNTLNRVKREYEVFKSDNSSSPTFFKIQGNDSDYKAKLVRGTVLYTNVPYLVVFQSQYSTPCDRSFPEGIKVEDTFRFETMGRKFLGKVLIIKSKTARIDVLVSSWNYQLEASETLTLLWPPASQVDDVMTTGSEEAFLYSSFELQAHGNINVHPEDIKRIAEGISKVSVNNRTKIYKKNAEMVIDKKVEQYSDFEKLQFTESSISNYTVPDDSTYFLFNYSGVTSLSKGQTVVLTPQSMIRHYLNGYLIGCVYPLNPRELSGKPLLDDILAHYKRAEPFTRSIFDTLEISNTASQYIKRCEVLGLINTRARQFIKEGRL